MGNQKIRSDKPPAPAPEPAHGPGVAGRRPRVRVEWLLFPALLALTLALYGGVLNHYFTCDDFIAIQESLPSPYVRVADLLRRPGVWFFRPITTHWFPVTTFSYALDYAVYGLHPRGYHVTNLAFHWLAAVAIFYLARRLTGRRGVAALAALLYAAHPVHNEAVAWIGARFHSLGALFYMLAIITFARYLDGPPAGRRYYWLSVLCFALGLLTLESTVTAPVMLLVYHRLYRPGDWGRASLKPTLARYLPYGLLLAGFAVLRLYLSAAQQYPQNFSLWNVGKNAVRFFSALWAPSIPVLKFLGLFEAYPRPELTLERPYYWAAALAALAAGLLVAWAAAGKSRAAWLGARGFQISLLWVALTPSPFYILFYRERYAELPSIGFCILLAMVIGHLAHAPGRRSRYAVAVLVGVLFFSYVALTRDKLVVWRQASETVRQLTDDLQSQHPAFPDGSTLYFVNLPGYLQPMRVPTFNVGIQNAVRLLYRTDRLYAQSLDSPEAFAAAAADGAGPFYLFVYENGRPVDRTHATRPGPSQ